MEQAQSIFSGPIEQDGLLFGCQLDGEGAGRLIDWSQVEQWREEDGQLWVHLNQTAPRVQA